MLTIEIATDNAAFSGDGEEPGSVEAAASECARILRRIAEHLEAGKMSGNAIDANGNGVGQFNLEVPA